MYHKPDDPRAFLIAQLKKLQETQKTETLGSSIFSEVDVRTMFGMFDPTGKGKITRDQCKQGTCGNRCRWCSFFPFLSFFARL